MMTTSYIEYTIDFKSRTRNLIEMFGFQMNIDFNFYVQNDWLYTLNKVHGLNLILYYLFIMCILNFKIGSSMQTQIE